MEWLRLSLVLNEILQKTVPQLRDDDVKRAAVIKDMCDRIWSLYGRTGQSPAVLEPARLSFELAVDHTAANSPDLGLYLIRLGIFLEDTAKQNNDIHDLDKAIAAYEKAVQVTPPGTKQRARNLNSLSLALAARYNWLGELEDLRKSVADLKQAIGLNSEDPQDGLSPEHGNEGGAPVRGNEGSGGSPGPCGLFVTDC
jgi:tetratricopeptide (TPR) repeat protein